MTVVCQQTAGDAVGWVQAKPVASLSLECSTPSHKCLWVWHNWCAGVKVGLIYVSITCVDLAPMSAAAGGWDEGIWTAALPSTG